MARLSTAKLNLLKGAFMEQAMNPGQAAQVVGVTYATAKRYYEIWDKEIKHSLESRLLPSLEASVKSVAKAKNVTKPPARSRTRR